MLRLDFCSLFFHLRWCESPEKWIELCFIKLTGLTQTSCINLLDSTRSWSYLLLITRLGLNRVRLKVALYRGINHPKQRKKSGFEFLSVLSLLYNCTWMKASTDSEWWAGFNQWIRSKGAKIIKQEYLFFSSSLTMDVERTIIWFLAIKIFLKIGIKCFIVY